MKEQTIKVQYKAPYGPPTTHDQWRTMTSSTDNRFAKALSHLHTGDIVISKNTGFQYRRVCTHKCAFCGDEDL